MNWEMIGTICTIIIIQGGLLLAAAKSIFTTKKEHKVDMDNINTKLYDDWSIPIFVTRVEWEKSKEGRERRRDQSQRYIGEKIDKLQETQDKTNETLNKLLGSMEKRN